MEKIGRQRGSEGAQREFVERHERSVLTVAQLCEREGICSQVPRAIGSGTRKGSRSWTAYVIDAYAARLDQARRLLESS